jgi:hypothetical protein
VGTARGLQPSCIPHRGAGDEGREEANEALSRFHYRGTEDTEKPSVLSVSLGESRAGSGRCFSSIEIATLPTLSKPIPPRN